MSGAAIDVIDPLELDRELYTRSFRDYVPPAFEVLESGEAYAEGVRAGKMRPRFTHGWHIDAIAEHLQAVTDGHIKHLLINIPPGTMKSVETCVLWPTWMWGRSQLAASKRFIFSSYSEEFTKRDTRKSKQLMQSVWYRERFPHVQLKVAPDTMMEHHNTLGGERHGSSTNSGVTGKHVHGIVEDDPLKAQDAQSERARQDAWFYRTQVLSSRLLPEEGWRVVVMQRLHADDPSGRILADKSEESYVHLNLPMEMESAKRCVTYIRRQPKPAPEANPEDPLPEPGPPEKFFEDPRAREDELLWPMRMGPKFVAEKKSPVKGLGANGYAGQYQQRPAPAGGSIIKTDWLRYYKQLPPGPFIWEQSWDLIFDGDGVGSFVVGQVWARKGVNHYLVHQYRERVDFPRTLAAFIRVSKLYPLARKKRVEKKANGAALLAMVKDRIPGTVPWPPKGVRLDSKPARLDAVSPLFEAGNVWVPDKNEQPWVESWIEEVIGMTPDGPTTSTDDQVDACTQYLADKGYTKKTAGFVIDLEAGARPSPWRELGG